MIEVLDYDGISKLNTQRFEFINNRSFTDRATDVFLCRINDENVLIGILKLNIKDHIVWFSSIEVLPECRNQGVARSLIKYLFIYCRSNRFHTISFSNFTVMGLAFVKPIVAEVALKYPYIHVIMDKRNDRSD